MDLTTLENYYHSTPLFKYTYACFQFTINTHFELERLQSAFLKSFHHLPRFTSKIIPSTSSTSTFIIDSSKYTSPIFIYDCNTFNKYKDSSSYNIYIDLRHINTKGYIFIRKLHAIAALGDVVRLVRLASLFYNDPSYHTEIIPVKPTPSISGSFTPHLNNWTLLKRYILNFFGMYPNLKPYTLSISKTNNSTLKQTLKCSTHDIVCALLTKTLQYNGYYVSSNIDFKSLRNCPYVGNGLSEYFIPDTIDISTTSITDLITTWTRAKHSAKTHLTSSPSPSFPIKPTSYIHRCRISNWSTLPTSNISFDNSSLQSLRNFRHTYDFTWIPLLGNFSIIGNYNISNSTSTFKLLLDSSQYSRLLSLQQNIDFSIQSISFSKWGFYNS